jgi:uncharacterized protein HemY
MNNVSKHELPFRQSLSLQPQQPDIIHILGEMYYQSKEWSKLQALLESADQLYTRWGNDGVHTGVTLASLFHKLGSFAYSVSAHHLCPTNCS